MSVSLLFFFLFSLSLCAAAATALQLLRRRRARWCSCAACRAYVTSSWTTDFTNVVDWHAHLLRSSPTGTVSLHVLGAVITGNPDNVEYMLKTNFSNFPKGPQFAGILGDLLGGGIFNADGAAWLRQRKMAALELGSNAVRAYSFSVVSSEIDRRLLPLLSSLAGGNAVVDIQDVFRRFAFDTICKLSFGLDPGCLEIDMPVSTLADAFDAAGHLSALRAAAVAPAVWKMKRLFNVGSEKTLRAAIKQVDSLAAAVIRERRKLGTGSDSHDLLSRFMAASYSGAGDGDDKYLRDIVVSFLLAGRDTVASALTALFLLLSKNPRCAAAMRAEVDGASPELTFEQLKKMHYCHAAVYESLRVFPPVQFDSKFCVADDVLPDGTFLAKGTRVIYHPYAMGRMPANWGGDCGEFLPERWLDGDGAFVPESLYKFTAFQAGPRVCVGKELAVMEIKAVAVAVLQRFEIEVAAAGGEVRFAPSLTATIAGGLPARVRCRR